MPRSLALLLALLVPTVALADSLPPSAAALVPTEWATEAPQTEAQTDWWTTLGGDELAVLVAQTSTSTDTQVADEALTQTRARRSQTTSAMLPSLSANGSWQTVPTSGVLADQADVMQQGAGTLDLRVPLTVWATAPNHRATVADTRRAESDLDHVIVSESVEVAGLWVNLLYARQRLDLVQSQIDGDTSLLTLVEARYAAGETSGVDVLRQRQQLAQSSTSLPGAQAAVGQAERALASFLRTTPNADVPVTATSLPAVPSSFPVATPITVVESHPQVQAAIATWQASQHRTTSARAAYLPTLNGTASAGWTYADVTKLETTPAWSVGVQVSVPLFNGGRTAATVSERRSAEQSALLQLEQRTIDVSRQVEDALSVEAQRRAEVEATAFAAQTARAALEASRAEYATGIATYNTVLSAMSSTKTAELNALATLKNHHIAALDLVAITGGLWVGLAPYAAHRHQLKNQI